ncbi:condensation domain-containing protein, partial [Nonomuraea sp. NPDC050556]|uniref:condensation domain-containing protein n=1 Tax=Nonomuraea sp. NPDC050556 TaxID=3364369 RepID=UPI0037A5E570
VLTEVWSQVLGVERVGVHDNFFDLGGDSILAIRLRASSHDAGQDFELSALFLAPTIASLALKTRPAAAPDPVAGPFDLICPADRQLLPVGLSAAYPATMLQAGMLAISSLEYGSATYHDVFAYTVCLPWQPDAMARALHQLTVEHDVLRTSFDFVTFSTPMQLVHETAAIPLTEADLRHLPPADQNQACHDWIQQEKHRTIPASQVPLLRIAVHHLASDRFRLGLSFHHAILDGWSVATAITELVQHYRRQLEGRTSPTAEHVSYRHYVQLEQEALDDPQTRAFWAEQTRKANPALLPGPLPDRKPAAGTVQRQLPHELVVRTRALAAQSGVPWRTVLLAACFHTMLIVTGEPDVTVGMVSHGRSERAGGDRTLGLFLNTLPLTQHLAGGTWRELIAQTHASEIAAFTHRRFPLAEMIRMRGGDRLFHTAFNFTDFHAYKQLRHNDIIVVGAGAFEQTDIPLMFSVGPDDQRTTWIVGLHGDGDTVDTSAADLAADTYLRVLEAMAQVPGSRYDRLVLGEAAVVPALPASSAACLHELFEEWVGRVPGAVAVVGAGGVLTYGEL